MERDYQVVSMVCGVHDKLRLKSKREWWLITKLPELCIIARSVHSLDECDRNGTLTEKQARRRDTLIANAAGLVLEAVGRKSKVHIFHHGDPRGASLALVPGEEHTRSQEVALY